MHAHEATKGILLADGLISNPDPLLKEDVSITPDEVAGIKPVKP